MKNLFNERKQKILSTLIVTVGAFIGFEAVSSALGLYQLKQSLFLSFYIYAFHIFWLTFLFDLHLKKRGVLANARLDYKGWQMLKEAFKNRVSHLRHWPYFRHYQNYLVLPGVIYWSVITLLLLNPFNQGLKQTIIFCSTFAMSVAYWFMKEHISRNFEHQHRWVKILAVVKLYAAFLVYSALLAVTFYFGYDSTFLFLGIFTLTFLLVYQALFQHRWLTFNVLLSVIIISLAMGIVSLWVYHNWNTEYLTGGLIMLAIYNFMWGLLHHHIEKTLTKKIFLEYSLMMILVVSLVLASHNFNQRVI